MAPISEKRSPPPHIKENAKENMSKPLTKKSLEILDFHESWLKDIEMYKNQVKMQQMLSTHNHVHTPEGCPVEAASDAPGKRYNQLNSYTTLMQNGNVAVDFEGKNLKRPREETPKPHHGKSNSSANAKRNNSHNTANVIQNQQNQSQETPHSTAKIIVNSFHASSLLNSKSGDLSARLLSTQNSRFTHKPKMTAPTDFPANTKEGYQFKLITLPPLSPSLESEQTTDESKADSPALDDDNCSHPNVDDDDNNSVDDIGDIDDLKVFEESDNEEEEYVGFPFMLDSDSEINCMSEAITAKNSTPQSVLTPSLFPQVPPYLTFSSHAEKGPNVPTALHKILKWRLSPVMPRIVRRVIFNSGFRLIKKTTDWMAVWEKHMRSPGFKTIRSHQKFNHLPGSFRIGRKDSMWKNLRSYMAKFGKQEFGFMQKTYILPEEVDALKKVWPRSAAKSTKWIVKPPASARGTGISVVNKWSQIPKDKPVIVQKLQLFSECLYSIPNPLYKCGFADRHFSNHIVLPADSKVVGEYLNIYHKNNACQTRIPLWCSTHTGLFRETNRRYYFDLKVTDIESNRYIERPLLINENKFDLRLYILVTSVNPLRIFMYKNGLARFASVKYSSEQDSLNDRCIHLTNYSINKLSENYAKNEDINACQGHKWTLQSLWSYLEKRHVDTKRLWGTLRNLVIKSLISGEGCLNRMYRQNVNHRYNCYELFGFDVLLDENLVPWLLEINISPSLHSELPLDLHVKGPLIQGVLNTALYQVPPKLTLKQQTDILNELNLSGPLCYNRHLFTTVLTPEETKKHNFFTSRLIEDREEYIETILDTLTPDDVRCLLIAEDELARSDPLERIFPNADTYKFLKYVENPRYYNRLLDAWETKYADDRDEGIELLRQLCSEGYHLKVAPAALIEEPKIDLTDIDLMYMKPDDMPKRRDSNVLLNGHNMPMANTEQTTNVYNVTMQPCSSEVSDGGDVHSNTRPIVVGTN